MLPSVLVLSGVDSSGRAGLVRDVAALSEERVEPIALPTCMTIQTRKGVRRIVPAEPDAFQDAVEESLRERAVNAVKIGLLPTVPLIDVLQRILARRRLPIVLDPVLSGPSEAPLVLEDTGAALRRLVPLCRLVTPNAHEAERLINVAIRDEASQRAAAQQFRAAGAQAALVKGGHLGSGSTVTDVLAEKATHTWSSPRLVWPDSGEVGRGKGCELSSRIAAKLAKGLALPAAVGFARAQVQTRLQWEVQEAGRPKADRSDLNAYTQGLEQLLAELGSECVPEVGSNLAWAPAPASSPHDIVGLAGRITIAGESFGVVGRAAHGGPHHTGRIALTLGRLRPSDWWVLNHRYTESLANALSEIADSVEVARLDEPQQSSTMEWMTAEAVQRLGGAPSYVFDRGMPGKEAMIRIFGATIEALLRNHRRLHERASKESPTPASTDTRFTRSPTEPPERAMPPPRLPTPTRGRRQSRAS